MTKPRKRPAGNGEAPTVKTATSSTPAIDKAAELARTVVPWPTEEQIQAGATPPRPPHKDIRKVMVPAIAPGAINRAQYASLWIAFGHDLDSCPDSRVRSVAPADMRRFHAWRHGEIDAVLVRPPRARSVWLFVETVNSKPTKVQLRAVAQFFIERPNEIPKDPEVPRVSPAIESVARAEGMLRDIPEREVEFLYSGISGEKLRETIGELITVPLVQCEIAGSSSLAEFVEYNEQIYSCGLRTSEGWPAVRQQRKVLQTPDCPL